MAQYVVTDAELTSVADAIRARGGTSAQLSFPGDFVSAVNAIPTDGGGTAEPKELADVNFFDYDGTIVYNYTAAEFLALDALPRLPYHTGLTAQGWNWTLADAKTQVQEIGLCDIGANYITSDGKTRIYCRLPQECLSIYLGLGVNGTVSIDWGDNSEASTLTGTSLTTVVRTPHVYANAGNYVVTITVANGSFAFIGNASNSGYSYLLNNADAAPDANSKPYLKAVSRIELGENAKIGNGAFTRLGIEAITIPIGVTGGTYAFTRCYALNHVTLPSGFASVGTLTTHPGLRTISLPLSCKSGMMFDYGYSIVRVIMPYDATSLGSQMFRSDESLKDFVIPNNVKSIPSYAFAGANISKLTIPAGVTSIATNGFNSCGCLQELHFKPTTPPTAAAASSFSLSTKVTIYVPAGTLEAYTTATNYPSSSTYTYVEE